MVNAFKTSPNAARLAWVAGATICIVVAFSLLILLNSRDLFFQPTDLGHWLDDSIRLKRCLSGQDQEACTQISKFPLAYLANSILLQPLRASNGDPRAGMEVLQAGALCLPIAALIGVHERLRTGLILSGLYVVLLFLTPLPVFYVNSGALETQAGVFIGMALLFGLTKLQEPKQSWEWFSNTCLLIGCLYKDTMAPTILVAVLLCKGLTWKQAPSLRLLIKVWGPGLLAAAASSIAWNLVRYHNILPLGYLEEATLNRPSPLQVVTSLWALYLSPNGGFVAFWGSSLGALILMRQIRCRCRWQFTSLSFQSLVPLAIVGVGVSSMAFWWAPFGWVAWGARLSVPFALAGLIVGVGQLPLQEVEKPLADQQRLLLPRTTGFLSTLVAVILISRSAPYVALGYTHSRFSFFPELNPSQSLTRTSARPGKKSCTERMFEEMARQVPAHPNPLVRMWRTKTYWPCIEEGMRADPTKN